MEIRVAKILLKRLVECASRAIRKRAVQNVNDNTPDKNLEEKIIEIFSDLLEEKYDRKSFYKQIINKNLPNRPSAKMVVKLIFNFIYCVGADGVRITADKIEEYAKEIVNMISKLNNHSRFFPFKTILKTKFLDLEKIKLQCFRKQSDDIQDANLFLNNAIKSIKQSNVLELHKLCEMIDELNGYIASVRAFYSKSGVKQAAFFISLGTFFTEIDSKLKLLIKNKDYEDDKAGVNSDVKSILENISISKTYLAVSSYVCKCLDACISSCKLIDYYTQDDEQKFENRETHRKNRSYNFDSFEKALTLNEEAIKKANQFFSENNFRSVISDQILEKYRKMLKERDYRLLEKKFFDDAVKQMTNAVYREISAKKKSESMFGGRKPTSNQVLNKITNLF